MQISVIIPCYNAAHYLPELLRRLAEQSVKPHETIIVDSSSPDDTAGIASRSGARLITIDKADFDHGGTRSLGGRQARGDILVFMTQDVLPSDQYSLEKLVHPFRSDPAIAAAYGRQYPYPDASLFSSHLRMFNYPAESYIRSLDDRNRFGIKTAFLSDAFSAYRKTAIEAVGWFRENLIIGEDTCAGATLLMAGFKLAYAAEAGVFHSHNYTLFQEFRRYFDIGVFHRRENWILETFGKAEGEGMKYIRSELAMISRQKKYHLLPEFMTRNAFKYLGYKLGRNCDKLPLGFIKLLSMHPGWWEKTGDTEMKRRNSS